MDTLMKAATYNHPKEIPMQIGTIPLVWMHYGEEMVRIAKEYPEYFPDIPDINNIDSILPPRYRSGEWVDEWGCVWTNIEEGMDAIVNGHPLKTREDILALKIPEINKDNLLPHGFMYLRILDTRGFEEAMVDFAEECDELQVLIDKILEYNLRQIDFMLEGKPQAWWFGDDLGMQKGLAIGPDKWRKYMKPCFKKMYDKVRAADCLVYMHTDGMIYEIIPDLIECGVNLLNPQYRANGLDNIEKTCKGKLPVLLDLDRQMLPFCTVSDVDSHIRECVETMYLPEGGLAIIGQITQDFPLDNIVAMCEAFRKYRVYKG